MINISKVFANKKYNKVTIDNFRKIFIKFLSLDKDKIFIKQYKGKIYIIFYLENNLYLYSMFLVNITKNSLIGEKVSGSIVKINYNTIINSNNLYLEMEKYLSVPSYKINKFCISLDPIIKSFFTDLKNKNTLNILLDFLQDNDYPISDNLINSPTIENLANELIN